MGESSPRSAWLLVCAVAASCACGASQNKQSQKPELAPKPMVDSAPAAREARDDANAAERAPTVASPVSGPALEDLPPPPPRPLSRGPIDLTGATEPPRLVIDGSGHTSKIRSVHYTRDGRELITAGYDKTVRIWSATTGELKTTLRGEIGDGPAGRIYSTALSYDDSALAVGGWLGTTGAPAHSTGSSAFQIRIVDLQSEQPVRLLAGHTDVVLSLAFAHRSARLLSGGGDHRALIFDAQTGNQLQALPGHAGSVLTGAWSPDDRLVATGTSDRTVRIFEADSGRNIARITLSGEVRVLQFTPSGRSILTGSSDGEVAIWDSQTGEHKKTLAKVGVPVGSISISPNGLDVLVTTAGVPYASYVYDIDSGKRTVTYTGQDNVVLASAISPNGRWAVTAGGSAFEIDVWELATGKREVHTQSHGRPIWNVGFSARGDSIAWGQDYGSSERGPYQINGALSHQLSLVPGRHLPPAISSVRSDQTGFLRAEERAGAVEVRTADGKDHEQLDVWSGGRRIVSLRRDVDSGFLHRAFSLSPNGNVVVSGGDNGVLASFDTRTGRKLNDFSGHTGDILALAVSPDGQRMVSGSSDQTVRLWDLEKGKLLLTVFPARNGEWIAMTEAGYYASSAYGDGYVGWHINRGPGRAAAYFPTSALSTQLRFPDVVLRSLSLGGDVAVAVRACNEALPAGAAPIVYYRFEDLPQFAPPDVYYLDPGHDLRIESDRIEVTARAHSPTDEPIVDLSFLVNGRPVDALWRSRVAAPRLRLQGRDAELTATLPLPEKNNRISVVASNRFNESEPITFEVERTGGPKELEKLYQPELYLLAVGISAYGSPKMTPLSYAHEDAQAISLLLEKQNRKLYKHIDKRVLVERQASRSAVEEGLRWLRRASHKDLAVVFLSGYSARTESGDYYFLPHDADPKRLAETALPWSVLREVLDQLPARTLLLLDSSHAGLLTEEEKSYSFDLTDLFRRSSSASASLALLSSSTGAEASYESDAWKHGAFTKALLEGLGGAADYDHDRKIHFLELEDYVSRRVPKLTRDLQHPSSELPKSLSNFPISDR